MTEYEKLSLSLLSAIAHGIALRVTQAGMVEASMKHEHAQEILRWQQNLADIIASVKTATQPNEED